MSYPLSIEQYQETTDDFIELGVLADDATPIGREVGSGIVVANPAVSSEHGIFIPHGGHWFFKDLGSSNGSWINGNAVEINRLFLIRPGDVLRIADVTLNLVGTSIVPKELIVLQRGNLIAVYPITIMGKILVIGGPKGDLKLDVDVYDAPSVVVEARGERVVAFGAAREAPARVNSRLLENTVILQDRDLIEIGSYQIFVSIPYTTSEPVDISKLMDNEENRLSGALRGASGNSRFGKTDSNEDSQPGAIQSRERLSSMHLVNKEETSLEVVEDRVVFIIAGVLLLAILIVCFILYTRAY